VSVGIDRADIVIVGGLNPIAVLEEHGIATESKAMSTPLDDTRLNPFKGNLLRSFR
jgi:repressor of nif and glnA expression